MKVPAKTLPCWEASIRAEPRKAPTQGVQPSEKITPKSRAEKKPILLVSTDRLLPLNRFSLNTPRKLRPKKITTIPEMMFTAV